jgi:hypothetical protein
VGPLGSSKVEDDDERRLQQRQNAIIVQINKPIKIIANGTITSGL